MKKISIARIKMLLAIGLLLIAVAGCSKFVFKPKASRDSQAAWPAAGFNSARTFCIETHLDPPLQEVARFKLSSAVAQNIFMNYGYLFVPTLDGRLFVIDPEAMKIVSKRKMPGGAGTLAFTGNTMIVASRFNKRTLFSFDVFKRDQLWEIDAGDLANEPLVADSTVYVASLSGRVAAYRLHDGRRLWQFRAEGQLHASPVMAEDIIVAASSAGKIYGLKAENGEKLWEADCEQPVLASPAIHRGRVYLGTGRDLLMALALHSGEEQWRVKTPGRIFQAPAVNDSLVIFAGADGWLRALAPESGKLEWNSQAMSVAGTSPLIAGDQVFFGSLDNHVYALNSSDGALLWRQQLDGRVRTNPIIWKDKLIVASEDRYLYIFGPREAAGTN